LRRVSLQSPWLFKKIVLFLLFLHPLIACAGKSSGQVGSVSLSPDGKVVAVELKKGSTAFIYRVSVDTGVATRLTTAKAGYESSPAFSADGKRIAFTYRPEGGSHAGIVLVNSDGSAIQEWSPTEVTAFSPVLSADNKTIVFGRSGYYGSYSPIAQPHLHEWRFFASDLDGSNVRPITNESFYGASPASVSPDGKSMAVMTVGFDAGQQIAIYSLAGPESPTRSLKPHVPKEADHKNPIVDFPNYMPDGKSLLFLAASNGKLLWSGFDYDVYRIDIETGAVERLTKGNGYASDLKVSADGKTAAFLKWRSDWRGTPVRSELYLLDVQSHKLTPLRVGGLD
jgi:Tol biopolymer transport system component